MRRQIPATAVLLAFEAAARHQSFTKAAGELSLTQSAVCRQINGLEAQLGVALFRRNRRGVMLTEAGHAYARQVAQHLTAIERDTLDLMAGQGAGGTIELAVAPTFATRWLLPRLAEFARLRPDVTVNLTTRTRPFLFDDEAFDAAIYNGDGQWAGAETDFLLREDLVAVASPALLDGQQHLTPQRIAAMPLLQQTTRPTIWREWFESLGLPVSHAMAGPRYELFSMLAQAARCQMGVALIPRFLLEEELSEGKLVVANPHVLARKNAYYLARPEGRADHPALTHFRDWLIGEARAAGRALEGD